MNTKSLIAVDKQIVYDVCVKGLVYIEKARTKARNELIIEQTKKRNGSLVRIILMMRLKKY